MSGAPVPAWLLDLAARVDQIEPAMLTRVEAPAEGGRPSAVLMLFGPVDDVDPSAGQDVLLTQRAAGMRSHAGQVAFPGGSVDAEDPDDEAAALREAWEETGLDVSGVQVLGRLPGLYLPPSGYLVTPVLAWWVRPSPVGPVDPVEVSRAVRVPLAELLDPANRFQVRHPSGYAGPGFSVQGLFVWGFTAGLLSRVLDQAGLTQPWDESRLVDLPGEVG